MLRSLEGLRSKEGSLAWLVAAALWAALIFVLSAIPGAGSSGDVTLRGAVLHVGEYAVLGGLLRLGGLSVPAAALASVAYGFTDELHQAVVPGRDASFADLGFDVVGAVAGVVAAAALVRR